MNQSARTFAQFYMLLHRNIISMNIYMEERDIYIESIEKVLGRGETSVTELVFSLS